MELEQIELNFKKKAHVIMARKIYSLTIDSQKTRKEIANELGIESRVAKQIIKRMIKSKPPVLKQVPNLKNMKFKLLSSTRDHKVKFRTLR